MTDVDEMEIITMDPHTQFKANYPPIYAPRWHDNTMIVRADIVNGVHNKIRCTYKRPDGSLMFPDPLYISGIKAKQFKAFTQMTQVGPKRMRAIPVSAFKRLKLDERLSNVW